VKTNQIQYFIFTYAESWYKWSYCSIRETCFILLFWNMFIFTL